MGFFYGDIDVPTDDDFIHANCTICGHGFAFVLDEYECDCECGEVVCQTCETDHADLCVVLQGIEEGIHGIAG